jgi:transglutaminase-like putative cysteine protease
MSWRIRIRHASCYRYESEVFSSYNEARVIPQSLPTQLVLDAQFSTSPSSKAFRYIDYWGTVVHAFDFHAAHTTLEVVGSSVVETTAPLPPLTWLSWDDLASERIRDDFAELLAPTRYAPADQRVEEVASLLMADNTPQGAANQAINWVRDQLTYVTGATGVHTSAIEAWDGGQGVCQDFAHLSLTLLRSMGIPARYCSGYLHPNPDAGIGTTLAGESHAWVEYWTGSWQGIDPTIGWPVGERHVLVAKGRDYGDVAPLKGMYNGGQTASLDVSVQLTRLG